MPEYLVSVLIILLLILLNALFVTAEFAMVGVPRTAIERLAAQGNRMARLVRQILRDPQKQDCYMATAQLGITVASLGLGMYGEQQIAGWLVNGLHIFGAAHWVAAHAFASVLALIILTYIHIVLGEMAPKSLALQSAERTALWITPLMRWMQFALYPLVISLYAIGNGILKLLGIHRELSASHFHTPQEIEYLVEESASGGLLHEEAGKVLRDLFEFGDLTAGEAMISRVRVQGLPIDISAAEMTAVVRESRHTRYPVFEGDLDHIVGMVHIKDILRLLLSGKSLRDNGIRQLPYVPETTPVDTVLATMRRTHVQMVVVMDEQGGTAGIITLEDLFEEVIGDIDEGVTKTVTLQREADGRVRTAGTVRLDELSEALDASVEHDEVDTVGGLILTLLNRPPVVGDVVHYQHLSFEVTAVQGHGVGQCLVSREVLTGE